MRAIALPAPAPVDRRPLREVDLPDPDPAPNEIVLAVTACAVCRTDLQLCEGDVPARALPIVLGHQAVGSVVRVAEGVSGWSIGDRAGVGWLGWVDGTCRFCRSGHENLCPSARFTGWDRNGGFADQIAVTADFAFRLPDGVPDLQAAPLLCGGIIGYRSLRVAGTQRGDRLGLYGFGASARQALQVGRSWGCEVYVTTRSERDRGRALELGAAWAGPYDERPPVALDAAVTFAPSGDVVVAALRALRPGGTVAINAIHLDRIPEFPYELLWEERSLRSVANYTRGDGRAFLRLAQDIPVRSDVDVFPLTESGVNDALAALSAGVVAGAAVLVADG